MDYEAILQGIDKDISKAEETISTIKVNLANKSREILLYTIPIYISLVVGYMIYIRSKSSDSIETKIFKTIPVMVGPILIYYTRKFVYYW